MKIHQVPFRALVPEQIDGLLSSKEKKMPGELEVKKIQEILKKDGVDLTKGGETQNSKMAN